MKAAVYAQFGGPISIRDLPDPTPGSGSVLIRVEANGICRSDWHGWMGHDPDVTLPHVPGHELAGVIEEVGSDVRGWRKGERVTVPFACGCGRCPTCLDGFPNICDHYFQPGFTHWGSFAELVAIRYAETNLVRLPDELDFVTAAALGCRFTTAYRAVVAQGGVTKGQQVAVHGCGGVGLSAVMIASALGAHVIAVDIDNESLALAGRSGAEHTIRSGPGVDVPEEISRITGGGADVSIDAFGSRVTSAGSIRSLRKRGTHVQVGLLAGEESDPPIPMGEVVAKELKIVGSHGLQASEYPRLIELILAGRLAPASLVTKRISLDESPAALEAMGDFRNTGMTVIDRF